jgi:acyl-CoA thioesterase
MSTYNASKPAIEYRQLAFYRAIGDIPVSLPNLHACAHLYASDRNSLFLVSNALRIQDMVAKMGSLSHSVVFHVDSNELLFKGVEGIAEVSGREGWFCQEAWTPRSEGGRGMHESRIWDHRGVHIASTWQDGLVRKRVDENEKGQWEDNFDKSGHKGLGLKL